MSNQPISVTLTTIGNGAALELFQAEFDRVLENILDPSTDPEATRSITIKVSIKPGPNRSECGYSVEASSKLGLYRRAQATMFVARRGGYPLGYFYNPNQGELFPEDPPEPLRAVEDPATQRPA